MSDNEAPPETEIEQNFYCCVCDKSTSKTCNICKSAHYCSRPCQGTDWRTHKILCKAFAGIVRPEGNFALALLFPPDESSPRWVWLPEDETRSEELVQSLVGAGNGGDVEKSHQAMAINRTCKYPKRDLAVHTAISWKTKSWNSSIIQMTKEGDTARVTAGPWVIAVEQQETEGEKDMTGNDGDAEPKRHPVDMTLDDFRIFTEWLEASKPMERLT